MDLDGRVIIAHALQRDTRRRIALIRDAPVRGRRAVEVRREFVVERARRAKGDDVDVADRECRAVYRIRLHFQRRDLRQGTTERVSRDEHISARTRSKERLDSGGETSIRESRPRTVEAMLDEASIEVRVFRLPDLWIDTIPWI